MKRGSSASRASFRVVWDENNLDYLETHKTPKQKIDEPKTPYHAPGTMSPIPDESKGPMDSAAHADALRQALQGVASSSSAGGSSSSKSSSNAGLERRKSFEDIRREHYTEFKTVKELMKRQSLDAEEDELAGGVGGIKIGENSSSSPPPSSSKSQ